MFYIFIFVLYSDWEKRKRIGACILTEVLVIIALIVGTLLGCHGNKRSTIVGIICLIFNICMYFSPLTVMSLVIKTKSVKYMPFYLSLTNFVNACVWFFYAFLKFDPYVLIPNGLGALSGLIQLGIYAYYYRYTNWDEDDEKQPQVQLSDNAARV
ncbi:hypothetical protein ACH5RR_025392 [Cinchona calisaya]|uniref:Uncharacterized protein n=1 Tax=Cinchona calisaya TaxID=153742 RepID=A0ABD2Z4I5_9GENT